MEGAVGDMTLEDFTEFTDRDGGGAADTAVDADADAADADADAAEPTVAVETGGGDASAVVEPETTDSAA